MSRENIFEIDGHKVEIRISGSGSLDPWTSEYASSINLSLFCTADMATFILVDDDHIYRLKNYGYWTFKNVVDNIVPGEFDKWLSENASDFGSLVESKKNCDEMKARSDAYKRMTPEEQEEYKRKWREERDRRIAEYKKKQEEGK